MVEARYNLSLTFMDAGRYEEAVAVLRDHGGTGARLLPGLLQPGAGLLLPGQYDEALEAYDMALEQKETVNVLNNIGLVYDKLGDKKEAARAVQAGQGP